MSAKHTLIMDAESESRYQPEPRSENDAVIQATQPSASARRPAALPDDALIIIPLRNLVLFPGLVAPINIGRERTIAAAQEATRAERQVGVVLQRDAETAVPQPGQLHQIGTVASILRYVTQNNGHYIVCQGHQRFRIIEFLDGYPFLAARVQLLPEADE